MIPLSDRNVPEMLTHSIHNVEDNCQAIDITDDTTNFKLITWNLWCMIFSPRTLSNPQRCGAYISTMAKREKWHNFDGLIICAMQELWSWKTGLFPPFILRMIAYLEYIPYFGLCISFVFQFLTLLCGVLPVFKCLKRSHRNWKCLRWECDWYRLHPLNINSNATNTKVSLNTHKTEKNAETKNEKNEILKEKINY